MGGCCSHDVALRGGGRIETEVNDGEYEYDDSEDNNNNINNNDAVTYQNDGTMVRLKGFSKFVSMYTQQGMKGVNQDSMTVWEDYCGEEGMVFCGVFDGHGPLGHKVSQFIRDNLPSTLSAAIKMAQQKANKYYDANDVDTDNFDDVHHNNNRINNISLASWEGCFLKSFDEMDDHLAREVNTDSYCSGCTAVALIKQGDQLIVGNLGDSRAVLCTRDRDQLIAVQLTVDLKPDIPSKYWYIDIDINSQGIIQAYQI